MFGRDPCLNGQLCPDENNILWQFSFTDMAHFSFVFHRPCGFEISHSSSCSAS